MNRRVLQLFESEKTRAARAAAYWLVRRDVDAISADDEEAFHAWLAASAQHRIAYERATLAWQSFDAGPNAQLDALRSEALDTAPRRTWPKAAAIVLACTIGLAVFVGVRERDVISAMFMRHGAPVAEHFASTQNDRSQVTLSDGSVVSLNWGSAIDVTFSDTERRIMLRRGEAFFAVAKNPKRPFIVDAGDRRIAALGTQFEVRLDRDRVEVVLLEGKVSVKDTGHNEQSSLLPNERLVAVRGAATLITQVNAQKQTSWRQGWLEFENDTLADAIAEFNRYSPQPIMLADPKVGALRISGVFHLSPPQRFAALVQELLPVKVDQDSEGRTQLRLAATSVRPGRSE